MVSPQPQAANGTVFVQMHKQAGDNWGVTEQQRGTGKQESQLLSGLSHTRGESQSSTEEERGMPQMLVR